MLRGKSLRPGGPTGTSLGDLNITVGGDIDITKDADAPVILLGSVDTVRGTYQFQGRRFDLVRGGTVRFTGEPKINPLLDVTATREIPNTGVEARVHITGSVRSPELELTSTPPLDESDILSLIVFNRPVNELGVRGAHVARGDRRRDRHGLHRRAARRIIGRALDLDLFEITTSTDDGEFGAGVTSVSRSATARSSSCASSSASAPTPSSCSNSRIDRLPAARGQRCPGNDRLRQPPRPAPHREGRHRPDLLFQLLKPDPPDWRLKGWRLTFSTRLPPP